MKGDVYQIMQNSQSTRFVFFSYALVGPVQYACMRLTSLNAPQGTRLSLHEADKASSSEWPQFLSCKFEAFENTNHDSVLTFDRKGALKISKRDLQEPRSGQDGSKFRHATARRGLVLKLSVALGFKFHDQWSM